MLTQTVINHIILYPTPISINYLWGFGSLAGLTLAIQILTGCLLAMHYTPHVAYAFDSVEHLMRDVSYGWLLRYTHANGASMFFIVVYIHICRGLFYGSYNEPRRLLWLTGVIIFFLMIITAFVGYVLPWGQMSLWGATVITSLCSSIPLIGQPILVWFWGGFSVDNPTLNRFFSLHYLLPFIITGVVLIHLVLLHVEGSSEPSGASGGALEYMPFYPYFYNKDLFGFMLFVLVFSLLVFFAPNALGHSDNYIVANPMVTPEHIVPEWYFLAYYAILRAVPDKLAGVICMVFAIVCLGIIYLFSQSEIKPIDFQPAKKLLAVAIICLNAILAWLGQCEAVYPFVQVGQFTEILYFGVFLLCLPFLNLVDTLYYRNSVQRLYMEFLYMQYLLFMSHRAERFRLGDLEEYRRKVMYRINQKRLFRLGNFEDQESHWFNHFLLLAERTSSPIVRELIQNFGIYMRWADRAVWRKFSYDFYLKSLKMYRTLKHEIDPYQLPYRF